MKFKQDLVVGINPDIISLSKPLAAGLPLSATLIPAKVNDIIQLGDHGTTFGGGPVTTAVADAVLDAILDPEFLFQVQEKGKYLTNEINELSKRVDDVIGAKGIGLLQGIELKTINPSDVVKIAMSKGLLILRSGTNMIRLAPPLIVNNEKINKAISIIEEILIELSNK